MRPDVSTTSPATAVQLDTAATGYYSIAQATELLGVSRVSIWRWIRDGRLPAARLGRRTVRIKRDDLEQLLVALQPTDSPGRRGHQRHAVKPLRARAARWDMSTGDHFVQFYDADTFLLDAVAEFIGAALRADDSGIVIATEAHRQGLDQRLEAAGLHLGLLRSRGRYVALDAAETLARFMTADLPDPERFAEVIGGVIAQAAEQGRRVHAFGEMVALLAAAGNHRATIRLEELWNELGRMRAFALFCAYPMTQLRGSPLAELLDGVCATHRRVIPTESYTTLASPDEQLRAVTLLQQKAESLQAEIEQRRQAQEQLQRALEAERAAREAAEAAMRVRDEFLSIASHELKTPLTSLLGQAQLMRRVLERDGQLDAERAAQAVRSITGQGTKLARLINQLFDVSRLEAGKLLIERQPTDLTALVQQAVAEAQSRSAQHTITLQVAEAVQAEVDPLRVEQVLTNLLDNAVKYSPDGGPIEVTLARADDATVELCVRDHGLGIPPEQCGEIFERFYQAHAHDHRSGLGLGLYISRQIVERHGGQIGVKCPPDDGARFTVRLPLAAEAPLPLLQFVDPLRTATASDPPGRTHPGRSPSLAG